MKLFLSCGHDRRDYGTEYRSYREFYQLQKIVAGVEYELLKALAEHELDADIIRVPTPLNPKIFPATTKTLTRKVKYVNALCDRDDLAIEFHLNAPPSEKLKGYNKFTGAEIIVFDNTIVDVRPVTVLKEYCQLMRQRNRGIHLNKHLFWTRKVKCSSWIFELGFIDDLAFMAGLSSNTDVLVRAIVNSLTKVL